MTWLWKYIKVQEEINNKRELEGARINDYTTNYETSHIKKNLLSSDGSRLVEDCPYQVRAIATPEIGRRPRDAFRLQTQDFT